MHTYTARGTVICTDKGRCGGFQEPYVCDIHTIYSGESRYLNPCQVWPLAKKCVIYNCNGRCILTMRSRISTNKSRKLHFITFMTLFVFDVENKYLTPQANSKNSGCLLGGSNTYFLHPP